MVFISLYLKKITDKFLSKFQDMLSITRKEKNEYISQKNAYSPKILHQILVWGHFRRQLGSRREVEFSFALFRGIFLSFIKTMHQVIF